MNNNETIYKEERKFTDTIISLMKKSPTSFHVCENNIKLLKENGYQELYENEIWKLEYGKNYFVTRNNSAIIAFKIPKTSKINGFMIACSHSDHPCFKVISDSETDIEEHYRLIMTEPYPSTLNYTWFDCPLSVAGRVVFESENKIIAQLVNVDRPLLMIPSLSLHMQRNTNKDGVVFDNNVDLRPIFSINQNKTLMDVICEENNIDKNRVIDSEIFVYRYTDPILWGADNEFLSARAIDDQISVFSSLLGLIESNPTDSIPLHAVFDNEEIGSSTYQGAESSFLYNTVIKILEEALNITRGDYINTLPNSFALSVDNAHALHPNYIDKFNSKIRSYMGRGAAIKFAASYCYCTNAISASILRQIARKENVKVQSYANVPGTTPGGTLSKFLIPYTSIGADIGIPQLAMHSSYETCSAYDALHLKNLIKAVYSSSIIMKNDGEYEII